MNFVTASCWNLAERRDTDGSDTPAQLQSDRFLGDDKLFLCFDMDQVRNQPTGKTRSLFIRVNLKQLKRDQKPISANCRGRAWVGRHSTVNSCCRGGGWGHTEPSQSHLQKHKTLDLLTCLLFIRNLISIHSFVYQNNSTGSLTLRWQVTSSICCAPGLSPLTTLMS